MGMGVGSVEEKAGGGKEREERDPWAPDARLLEGSHEFAAWACVGC